MRTAKWSAHAHLILFCAGASHFVLRRRISFCSAQVHVTLFCAGASHFVLRRRISFCFAQAHLTLFCAGASHFILRRRISCCSAQAHLVLFFAGASHINELAWKSVVRGDLYESPYLAKATPFMESQKGQYSRLLISSNRIVFSQLYYLNSQLASLFPWLKKVITGK